MNKRGRRKKTINLRSTSPCPLFHLHRRILRLFFSFPFLSFIFFFPPSSVSSLRSSQAGGSSSARSRSGSVKAPNINTPPISNTNSQTAFIKIKIFDRVADDVIAIRVHPLVSHHELMDKVQARLGGDVALLRHRDDMSNEFIQIETDGDLRSWLSGTDKHVLYAD